MAIDKGTETIAVTTKERTWRVNIETALGADPVVSIYRETVRTDPNGAIISKEQSLMPITRALSSVVSELQDFTPSQAGKITGAELAGLIAARADLWRQEEISSPTTENDLG